MNWPALILGLLGLVLLGLLLYWQLVIAEGAYLGPRIVTLMYDWSARVYERIKQYDAGDEQWRHRRADDQQDPVTLLGAKDGFCHLSPSRARSPHAPEIP